MPLVSCSMRMSRVYATAAITIISARMTAKLTTILRRIVRFFIVSITLEPVTARRRKAPERSRGVENGCSRSQIVSSHCTGSAKKRAVLDRTEGGCAQLDSVFASRRLIVGRRGAGEGAKRQQTWMTSAGRRETVQGSTLESRR